MRIGDVGSGSLLRATSATDTRQLAVPDDLRDALRAAVRTGQQDAAAWLRSHPASTRHDADRDAIASIPPPPDPQGEVARVELDELRSAARGRTQGATELARAYARNFGAPAWDAALAEIRTTQGPAQARAAAALLQSCAERTDAVTDTLKHRFDRRRPYAVDPSIGVVVQSPGRNPSYPSGHTSSAFASALVLASFLPERAAELVDVAEQVAWSRMYGGVHFRSDVLAGARIAARVAADVLARGRSAAYVLSAA